MIDEENLRTECLKWAIWLVGYSWWAKICPDYSRVSLLLKGVEDGPYTVRTRDQTAENSLTGQYRSNIWLRSSERPMGSWTHQSSYSLSTASKISWKTYPLSAPSPLASIRRRGDRRELLLIVKIEFSGCFNKSESSILWVGRDPQWSSSPIPGSTQQHPNPMSESNVLVPIALGSLFLWWEPISPIKPPSCILCCKKVSSQTFVIEAIKRSNHVSTSMFCFWKRKIIFPACDKRPLKATCRQYPS